MWCLTDLKKYFKHGELANDFDVCRYYDLKIRTKGNKYRKQLPTISYNGIFMNEFQIKIEKYLSLDEKSKKKIKLKAKKQLPYFEQKFKQLMRESYEKKNE
jgi:hypothetical protein